VVCDLGLTESHSGSDPKSVRTRAQRAGDDFLISGEKSWISNGPILDMIIVVARCDGADGDASFNAFIVDTRSPGVSVSEPTPLMMRSAGGVAQFFFDEVRVPASSILGGEEGRGLSFMMGNINLARLATAARMVAACELAFELTLDFVKSRQAFGRRVLDFQNTQFKLAQLKTEIAVGRAYVDSLLHAMSSGAVTQTETSMAKLWVSEMEGRVMDECVQLHGGAGVSHEYPIAAMYAFARIHRIYLGTSEIQKVAIARSFVRD